MTVGEPLEVIGQSAVNAGADAIGGIINMVVSKAVDALFGDSPTARKKLTDEYYERVRNIVDNHDYNPRGGTTPQQRAMQEIDEVDQSIVEAVQKLERAHNKSRCGMCRSSLEETINLVKKKAEPIFDATDKIRAMQKMKAAGKLPQNALWDNLTPQERKEVEKTAETVAKPRDFSPHRDDAPDARAVPAAVPILMRGGMDGEEESQPVRKRSYPIRKTKPVRKPAKRAVGRPRKRN